LSKVFFRKMKGEPSSTSSRGRVGKKKRGNPSVMGKIDSGCGGKKYLPRQLANSKEAVKTKCKEK